MTALVFVALFVVIRAVGGEGPTWQATGWMKVIEVPAEWFMQFVDGAARLVKGGSDGASLSARLGCLLLLIILFMALRRWMLMYYAHKPGAVDVKKLVASAPGIEQQLEGLTAQLRKQLSETNLYPPTALPAEAPADNFLDLLGDVDLEPKKLGTSLLRLFSRLRPKIAYTVRGVLRVRDQEPGFGITVTVTSYAIRGSRTESIWSPTWEEAIQEAGYWVMATLVPVTRAGRRPPWQGWRGQDLPPDLFAAYQQARELSQERKFDDALDRYYEALRLDPTNLYLRTQIAGIQEQLWLHLDALETYYGAILLDGQNSAQRNARTGMRSWDPRRILRRRYGWWQSGLLEARFRYAVVLGVAERTAYQWCKSDRPPCPRRAHARKEIRQALAPALAARHWRAFMGLIPPGGAEPFAWDQERRAKEWLETELGEERRRYPIVREIFQLACREEMQQLAADYPRMIRLRHPFVRAHGTLTRTSLRLNRDVWAPLRLAWAHEDAERDGMGLLENPLSWPSSAETLAHRTKRIRGPFRAARRWLSRGWRLWQDNYNAACVYAVAMNGTEGQPEDQERRALADLAVDELEGAAHADVSGVHPVTRSWLLIEDPDLEKLRQENRFIRFERETFPHAAPDRHRPERPLRPEMKAYDKRLLSGCAAVMEHTWRVRRRQLPADGHVLAQWFVGEAELWRCVDRIASDQGRNWRDRERLLQRVREIADNGLLIRCGLPSRLPELDELLDDATWDALDDVQERITSFEETFTDRLSAVSLAVAARSDGSANHHSPIRLSGQWLASVRQNGSSPDFVKQAAVHQVCSDYEMAWRALRELLDPEESATALSDALLHFHTPHGPWRALAVIRTGGPHGLRRAG
ncbi:tetratricopeptide repeat protein [Streptomyces sp. NBC_00683]|uniref:tetratricopeptide repeat protein n=1 Tax=Streptomyces sp. NBC_00683 TaxID=2903670 RepID=UPI002E375C38|nr:tetratricopeptide repeat protein [Streptomyces sp. NBC_00683]